MLGEPGRYDPSLYDNEPGGDDETVWFSVMLQESGLGDLVRYEGRHIARGDPLPEAGEADAIVLGGTYHSVHDDRPWQRALIAWLSSLREAGTPLIGLCGGHQSMAFLEGGVVEPLADGPRAGTFEIDLTGEGRRHFLFDGMGNNPAFQFGNYDHVSRPPDGARILAASHGMPAMALDHGGGWLSVQFHPEAKARMMAGSWGEAVPVLARDYTETPDAPRLFHNFLTGTGVLTA